MDNTLTTQQDRVIIEIGQYANDCVYYSLPQAVADEVIPMGYCGWADANTTAHVVTNKRKLHKLLKTEAQTRSDHMALFGRYSVSDYYITPIDCLETALRVIRGGC